MLIIPTVLENLTSRKDKTWKLTMGTQELTPDQVRELSIALNRYIFTAIKVDEFRSEEKDTLDQLESGFEETGKTQSQRIRAVLFLLWKQDNKGFTEFDTYYKHSTELYINHLKTKIEP